MAEEVRSVSVPNIIYRTRTFLVFEQMVEYTVPAAGRFALMLESPQMPEPQLPALWREVEIYPRIVVETLGTAAGAPKAVFRSYTTRAAGVGMPGDSLGAITIGTDANDALTSGGTGLARALSLICTVPSCSPPAVTASRPRSPVAQPRYYCKPVLPGRKCSIQRVSNREESWYCRKAGCNSSRAAKPKP